MRHALLLLATVALAAVPARGDAQTPPAVTASSVDLTALAKAWVAVTAIRDKAYAELAEPRNKKVEDQARIRQQLKTDIAAALKAHQLTPQEFDRQIQAVSANDEQRKTFEGLVAGLATPKPPEAP